MKKRAVEFTCSFFIILAVCTVLSFWVERVMTAEVQTVTAVEQTGTATLPASCLYEKNGRYVVFQISRPENNPVQEDQGFACMVEVYPQFHGDGTFTTEVSAENRRYVSAASRELKNNERVYLTGASLEEDKEFLGRQAPFLCLLALPLLCIPLCIWRISANAGVLYENGGGRPAAAVLVYLIVIFAGLFLLLFFVDIPNRFLPPENILDMGFYFK